MASSLRYDLSQDETGKPKNFLMRSNTMCSDDDTRLKSLIPQDRTNSTGNARKKHFSAASSLSKDSSHTDFTDSTRIDLLHFIVNTLHKNAKDREMLLNLELEMRKFVLDKTRQVYKFPKMSSYNRMLVHRVAAFFGLDHNIDQSGTTVIINKTPNSRVPDLEFSSCIKNNNFTDRVLSGRNVQSFDECRLDNFYGSFQTAASNIGSSIEMQVGEWHNSMAAAGGGSGTGSTAMLPTAGLPATYFNGSSGSVCGASSSNSNCSWNLTSAVDSGICYMLLLPEPMLSPVTGCGGIIPNSSPGYYSSGNAPFRNYSTYLAMNNGALFPVYQQLTGLPQQQQEIQYDNLNYSIGRFNLVSTDQELNDRFQQTLQIFSNPVDLNTSTKLNSLGVFVVPNFA